MNSKLCLSCHQEKPAEDFCLDSKSEDGLSDICRICLYFLFQEDYQMHFDFEEKL